MPKYIKQLKFFLIAAIIITFLMVIAGIYKSIKTVDQYKNSQIEMGNFILTSIKSSNRLLMRSTRFSKDIFQSFVEELSAQKSINNIIIYNHNKQIILSFKKNNQIPVNTIFDTTLIEHQNNQLILYSQFKVFFGNNMMKRHSNGQRIHNDLIKSEQNYFIAISLNMDNFNSLKAGEYTDLAQIVMLQILLIFIFLYTLKLIKMFEQSQKRLSVAEKEAELAKYSTTLAHEIKNPLSSISGLVSYTKENITDDSLNDYLSKATDEINRLNKIVNDFLQFGKEIQLSCSSIQISSTIEHTLRLVKYDAESKNISFDIVNNDFQIYADKDRMIQVMLNLLLNAVQAAPKNSCIKIVLKPESKQLLIINDIKEKSEISAEKLFQPFHSTKTVGTGLGLSISKKILDLHQFDISIVSTNLFTIQIDF